MIGRFSPRRARHLLLGWAGGLSFYVNPGHPSQKSDNCKEVRIVNVAIGNTFGDLDLSLKYSSLPVEIGNTAGDKRCAFFRIYNALFHCLPWEKHVGIDIITTMDDI